MQRDEQRPAAGSEEAPREGAEPLVSAEPEEGQAGETETAAQPTAEAAADQPGAAETAAQPAMEAASEEQRRELPPYVLTAAMSAAALLFALAFFMAGFWMHALLDEDGGTSPPPSAASDDPAWGPEDAAVTIEEFGDFQCPYCGGFARDTLPKIREAYGDEVRYVYRDFPLVGIHEFAQKAAEAAQCMHEQGLFWQYHDLLFADQEALAAPDLKRYAQQVGADTGEFDKCLDASENAWEVMLDVRDGAQAGVTGTPAFLINGVLLPGVAGFEQFQAIIDQALAGAGD